MRPGAAEEAASLRGTAGDAAQTEVAVAGIAQHWGLDGRQVVGRSCRATGGIAAWGLRMQRQ